MQLRLTPLAKAVRLACTQPATRAALLSAPLLVSLNAQDAVGGFTSLATLQGLSSSSVAWGDYDNDGDLDLILTGREGNFDVYEYQAVVYRNDGADSFTSVATLQGASGSVAWGDYDNDGDLDLILAGTSGESYYSTHFHAIVYRNAGANTFTSAATLQGGGYGSSVAWGDYDNDGDLDLMLTGMVGAHSSWDEIAILYRNDGADTFTSVATLPGVFVDAIAWGDYDNDGDLDLMLTGSKDGNRQAIVYRNDGADTFTSAATLPGVSGGSIAWGDYDNDGDLDLMLTGWDGSNRQAIVYRNDEADTFTSVASLQGVSGGSVAWGDYDNDGDLDLMLAGFGSGNYLAILYRNDGADTFTSVSTLQGASYGSVAWGDYDNDSDLDLILTGRDHNGNYDYNFHAIVYRNDSPTANTPPTTPTDLTATPATHAAVLQWTPGSDAETPAGGLSYNLCIGTAPGRCDVSSPMADAATGQRRLPARGPIQIHDAHYAVTGLTRGTTYYARVQAIDTVLTSSAWSKEVSFITPGEPEREINLQGQGQDIADGDTTPSIADGTDFGHTGLGTPVDRTFTIQNRGAANLNLTGSAPDYVTLSGANCHGFSVIRQPTTPIPAWGSTEFTLRYTSTDDGADTCTVRIANDDSDEDPYEFAIQGRADRFTSVVTLLGVAFGSVAWGDYDNDGDLDLILTGGELGPYAVYARAIVYRNDGSNTFTSVATLRGVYDNSVAWGDYDNDGDLDLMLTGGDGTYGYTYAIVYRNDGADTFTSVATLQKVSDGSVAWGDYDNDGDLDLLLTGYRSGNDHAIVYRNDGVDTFTSVATLQEVSDGSVAWGDYDNDGDLDLILTGSGQAIIYRNDGANTFTSVATLPGVSGGSVAWGDYDNDGDLDLMLTGSGQAIVYRNDGADTFTSAATLGVSGGSVAWGDYDNDGDLDLILDESIYRNDGADTFTSVTTLLGVDGSSIAWGDYDNDGDLDLLLTGRRSFRDAYTIVYRNDGLTANTAPTAPTDLTATPATHAAVLQWTPGSDAETPADGLSYNLCIGTAPGRCDVSSPMADAATGQRRLPARGPIQVQGTHYAVAGLAQGATYYARAQAIDTAFAGSAWSQEVSFVNTINSDCYPGPTATITNERFHGTRHLQAEGTLTTAGDVIVDADASVRFEAASRIMLTPGFRVESGGGFLASIGAVSCAASTTVAPPSTTQHTASSSGVAEASPVPAPRPLSFPELPAALREVLSAQRLGASDLADLSTSADGERIVFSTEAALVAEDTNGQRDVYGYDADSERLWLVSRASNGNPGNGPSDQPRIDGWGETIVYRSLADNLAWRPDTNAVADIYLHDLPTGTTTRASWGESGEEPASAAAHPDLGGDPLQVVFERLPDAAQERGIYRYDPTRGLYSERQDAGDCDAHHPALSADGRTLAYLCGTPSDASSDVPTCQLRFQHLPSGLELTRTCPSLTLDDYRLFFASDGSGVHWLPTQETGDAAATWSGNPWYQP